MPSKKSTKVSDEELDKQIAIEKKKSKAQWAKRFDLIKESLLITTLVGASVFSYSKGLFEIGSDHLEAMVGMLTAIGIACILLKRRV